VPSGGALRPSPDVVFRSLDDEAVLVHLGTNRIYSLNPTGARFWELLTDGCPDVEIKRTLMKEFDVPPETLEAEIDALLRSLESEGLVTPEPA